MCNFSILILIADKILRSVNMLVPSWSAKSPEWSDECFTLLIQSQVKNRTEITIKELMQKSNTFPIKFPIHTGRCEILKKFVSDCTLERNINSVYPIIHENVLELFCKFILFKKTHGSGLEKALYKDMDLMDFINRLLTKRAVTFVDDDDYHLLLNGVTGSENWETIGTREEKYPLILKDCLSYDEIKCSAFLSVSSYTYFINIGDRSNMGHFKQDRTKIEEEGIIIGLIGPRCTKNNVMDYQEIVIDKEQNTIQNGYGRSVSHSIHKLFSEFYEEECLDHNEIMELNKNLTTNDQRYTGLNTICLFDNHYYYKRLSFSIDTLLMESNYRAKLKGTTAYVHVVGIGLGVWKISSHQDGVFMDTFAKRISLLGDNLQSVSDICFAYIKKDKCGNYKNGEIYPIKDHPSSGIKIHIHNRDPHEKLVNEHKGKLLVVSYAWDANAHPGNEYWCEFLGNSSDSAAASSTQIVELHNPHINPLVSADNLKVVTKDDVISLEKYQELIRYKKSTKNTDQFV